jgi:hypothetical protein
LSGNAADDSVWSGCLVPEGHHINVIDPAWEHLKAILQVEGGTPTERSTAFKTTQAGSIMILVL